MLFRSARLSVLDAHQRTWPSRQVFFCPHGLRAVPCKPTQAPLSRLNEFTHKHLEFKSHHGLQRDAQGLRGMHLP